VTTTGSDLPQSDVSGSERRRIVSMHVFKGHGPTDVNLHARAPFGWWPAVVLSLVSLLDRLEQSMLAGALPQIQEAFDLSDTQGGMIALFTGVAGVLLFIPAGRIADRMNRKNGLAAVVASWAVLSLGTGLAVGFVMLLAMRTLIGAAGQLNNPAGSSLLADYYPGESRTKVYGIERLVYFLGNPLGIILGGVIAATAGWEWVFAGLVIPGIVISFFCWRLREPYRGTSDRIDAMRADLVSPGDIGIEAVAAHENKNIDDAPPADDRRDVSVWEDVRALFAVPTLRAVYVAQTVLFIGLGCLFYWMPSLFEREFDLAEGAGGAVSGSTGLIGIGLGAFLGIRLGTKYHGVKPGWRIRLGAGGVFLGSVGIIVLVIAPVLPVAALGFGIANVGFMIAIPNFTAAVADLCGSSRRGMAFSVMQLSIGLASAAGPFIVGVASDAIGSLQTAMIVPVLPLLIAGFLAQRAYPGYDRDAEAARLESVEGPSGADA
jgi:MFS family permease